MEGEEGEKVDKEEIEEINAKGEKEKRGKKNWLPKEEVEEVVRCRIMYGYYGEKLLVNYF